MTSYQPVSYQTEDRQWDVRINVQTDDYLELITTNIMLESANGKFKYILVSGLEVGTRPHQTDYQIRHIHVAVIFHNRASKSSIIKNWGINEGNGYYLVPRNRDFPYSGWRKHHLKEFSKVDPNKLSIFENGELPADINKKKVEKSHEEKKRKVDEILIDMRDMLDRGEDSEAFKKYPRNYLLYSARLKATLAQKVSNFFGNRADPHIWVHGFPGTGKTSVLRLVYPNTYKKHLDTKFWDLYDATIHDHVMLEDMDHECVERLGIQFLKTICDEVGFPIDQKYKTPMLCQTTVLVTSNFDIPSIVPDGQKGVEQTTAALLRRFWHIRIDSLLRILGVRLVDKWDRKRLKEEGNQDVAKLYMGWDYATDSPTGLPLKTPGEYQEKIRNSFYDN